MRPLIPFGSTCLIDEAFKSGRLIVAIRGDKSEARGRASGSRYLSLGIKRSCDFSRLGVAHANVPPQVAPAAMS